MTPIHYPLAGMPSGVIVWMLRWSSTPTGGRRLKVPVGDHVFMMSVAAKSAMVCEPSTGQLWGLFRYLRVSAILESSPGNPRPALRAPRSLGHICGIAFQKVTIVR